MQYIIYAIFTVCAFISGCATSSTAPARPSLIGPPHQNLRIAIAKPVLNLSNGVDKEPSSCTLSCDFEEIIRDESLKYFTDSFGADVVTVEQRGGFDLKFVLRVNRLDYKILCGYNWSGSNYEHLTFTGSLDAYNSADELLWHSNEVQIRHDPSLDFPDGPAIDHGKAVKVSVDHFLSELAKKFLLSNTLARIQQKAGTNELAEEIQTLPPVKVQKSPNKFAVVIGIEKYRDLSRADYAAKDAETVKRYLTELLGYPEENVVMLVNERATRSDIAKHLGAWLGNRVKSDSTVFVYFAGHGAPDPITGNAYLVPFDGDPSYSDATSISLKSVYDSLGKLPARQVLVALDSCFSGSGGRSVMAPGVRPLVMTNQNKLVVKDNMAVLAASSGNQTSTSYEKAGHGMFTYFLLKSIKDSIADKKQINLQSIYDRVRPSVSEQAMLKNVEQTPVLLVGAGIGNADHFFLQ